MALAVLDVLAAVSRTATVVGANATPDAIRKIKQGLILASAAFDAPSMGALAAEAAIRTLRGEMVPDRIQLPVQLVDATNLAAWDCDFARRASYPWAGAVASD